MVLALVKGCSPAGVPGRQGCPADEGQAVAGSLEQRRLVYCLVRFRPDVLHAQVSERADPEPGMVLPRHCCYFERSGDRSLTVRAEHWLRRAWLLSGSLRGG